MLPQHRRINRADEFGAVVRLGGRAATGCLVVHVAVGNGPSRAGLVVGRAVGGSVQRHRVSRRLRHCLAGMLDDLPDGTLVVVRALPPAATASSSELCRQIASGVRRASSGVGHRPGSTRGVSR